MAEAESSLEAAARQVTIGLDLLSTTHNGKHPDGALKLGPLLEELDAWLAAIEYEL